MHMLKQEVADKMTELITPMDVKRIVEIGTGFGESAKFFSGLKPDATIYTVDGFGLYGDGRIYNRLEHDKVKAINESLGRNVIQILANSYKVPWELPIDVLFIDGDHSYEGCRMDFINYGPMVRNKGLIVFDDYTQENNPNNGVRKVVDEILEANSAGYKILHQGYYSIILQKLWNITVNY
jgi:predicted O-methyltransferase YrrM